MQNIYQKILLNKPVVIAEAGVNHNGSLELGEKLIDAAKRSGADCIKFQTYKANKLTTKKAKRFWNWDGEEKKTGTQFDSYSALDKFDIKEYLHLFNYCKKKKIEFQSTPFDVNSVRILEEIGVKTYKIASCDITNFLLLDSVAKTKKPIFLSTGASNIKEIKNAVNFISKYNKKIAIMHCILCYPTKIEHSNLRNILYLKKKFPNIPVGLSDHTLGLLAPIVATSLGSLITEKHFTVDKSLPKSADHWLSIDESELTMMIRNIKLAHQSLGIEEKKPIACEAITRKNARRSLVANKEIYKGEFFNEENLTAKRPGTGISADKYFKFIGKKSKKNYKYDDLI